MKYSIGSNTVSKSFDFAAATESLVETYQRLGDAYQEVIAAESRFSELDQAMDACDSALKAIEKFGVTATTMAVFNGANELDQVLGLENLDLSAVESLGQSVRQLRKENYVAGLESKLSEYWQKVVAWLKDLWAKIKRFFKELFDRNAKLVRIVDEAAKAGSFKNLANSDAKAKILSVEQFKIAQSACVSISVIQSNWADKHDPTPGNKAALAKAGIVFDEAGRMKKGDDFGTIFEKKEIEVKSWAGWADTGVSSFKQAAVAESAKKTAQEADKALKEAVDAAQKAAKAEGASEADKQKAVDEAKFRRDVASKQNSAIAVYNSLISLMGNTLVSLASYGAKAKAPAAPAAGK